MKCKHTSQVRGKYNFTVYIWVLLDTAQLLILVTLYQFNKYTFFTMTPLRKKIMLLFKKLLSSSTWHGMTGHRNSTDSHFWNYFSFDRYHSTIFCFVIIHIWITANRSFYSPVLFLSSCIVSKV